MTIAFRYHHYKRFRSQIDLTKLTIVEGGLGNSLNKKNMSLLLKMLIFCVEYFSLEATKFSILVHVSHIKCSPPVLK